MKNFAVMIVAVGMSLSFLCRAGESEPKKKPGEGRKTKSAVSLTPEEDDRDTEVGLDLNQGIFLGYGGLDIGATSLAGGAVPLIGVRGGWVINEKAVLGISFYEGSFRPYASSSDPVKKDLKLSYSQASLLLEYIFDSHKLWHPVASLLIGSGYAHFSEGNTTLLDDKYKDGIHVFVIEPQIFYEFNMTKYLRFAFGGAARLANGKNEFVYSGADLTGVSALVGIKFGNFRY